MKAFHPVPSRSIAVPSGESGRQRLGRDTRSVELAVASFNAVIGPFHSEYRHGGSQAWGIITAVEVAGAFLCAVVAARWRPARPVVACALLPATAAIPMTLLGLGTSWPVLAAVMVLPGVCQTIYAVLWWTTIQRTFPPQVLARVNSWTVLGGFALTPAAVLAAGPLVAVIGPQQAAAGAALVIAAATIAALAFACLQGAVVPAPRLVPDGEGSGFRPGAPAKSGGVRG